jgi:hypothetical protein
MEHPTETEVREAAARGSASVHPVFDSYDVRKALVVPMSAARIRSYLPLSTRALVTEFTRLVPTEDSALSFVRRWGLVGWRPGDLLEGDPLVWLWGHSYGSWLGLQLVHRLTNRRPRRTGLAEFIEGLSLSDRDLDTAGFVLESFLRRPRHRSKSEIQNASRLLARAPRGRKLKPRQITLCFGAGEGLTLRGFPYDASKPEITARRIIQSVVNVNLRGNSFDVLEHDGKAFALRTGWTSLIGPIYRQLAEAAFGGQLVFCDECRELFSRTHGRSRFCPPAPGLRESQCASRSRNRRRQPSGNMGR